VTQVLFDIKYSAVITGDMFSNEHFLYAVFNLLQEEKASI